MRITKVHIDEYKIFKNFDIDFTHEGKSQNLIVLAGINGTGKTTLLKFIESGILKSNFIKDDSQIKITSGFENSPYSINRSNNTSPLLGDVFFVKTATQDIDDTIEAIVVYIDHFIYEKNINAFDAYDELNKFIEIILEGFELKFQFRGLSAHKLPLFKNATSDALQIKDLSSGEKQLLTNVLWFFLADIRDAVILIDEPEFSLHPSWQNLVAKVYQRYADEYNCQIILATHSPQIIGSVKPEQIRILKNDNGVIGVSTPDYSYGLPVDKVLMEVMGINHLRTPDVDAEFEALAAMISNEQYDTPEFIARTKKLEDTLGYADTSLVLMRFEIAKRRKQKQ